jgi:hypothetical protein
MVDKDVFLTDIIHGKLKDLAKKFNVSFEAMGNTLLVLAMCNDEQVKQAVNLIETWNIKGATEMEKIAPHTHTPKLANT